MPTKAKAWAVVLSLAAIALLPGQGTAASSKERRATVNIWALVDMYAAKYGIPRYLARNLVRAESGGRQAAVSSRGARGVMQLMPQTARDLGVNINDPRQNIEGGMRYLRGLFNRFKRWDLAVAAYHAGPQAVIQYGGIPPYPETHRFVAAVLQIPQGEVSTASRRSVSRPAVPTQANAAYVAVSGARSLPTGFQWPVQGIVTSEFGWRGNHHHDGIDIAAERGTPIHAARAGRVIFSSWYYEYGLMVVIDHGNGQETRYGHASALLVKLDEVVQAGQVIARVGCTGACTAPHVHFEIRLDGRAINPLGPQAASHGPTPEISATPPKGSRVHRSHARRSDQEQFASSGVWLPAPEDDDDEEGDY